MSVAGPGGAPRPAQAGARLRPSDGVGAPGTRRHTEQWQTCWTVPGLSAADVHLWRVRLRRQAQVRAEPSSILSEEEQERAGRIVDARSRERFESGRVALRTLLGRYLGLPPREVTLCTSPHGKPGLAPADAGGLSFNLAHSGDLALLAVAWSRRVGVDLEYLRPLQDAEALAGRFFSPSESAALRALPAECRLGAFFAAWTRKEAFLKALGEGIPAGLARFTVSLAPDEPARLVEVEGEPDAPQRWSLRSLEPAPGAVAALAVEGRGWALACWEYQG